jgi:hypothetical protein
MLLLKAIQNSALDLNTRYLGVAIGTDDTTENINQNALIAEAMRVASTNTISTTTVTNDTAEHKGDFTISVATLAVKEAGVSTTSTTGGDFAARQKFSVMNFVQNDNVIIIFKFVTSG